MNCTMMQRKALFLLLLVTVVSLPLLSRAMTQHEWNQGCYTKTKGQTTLYSVTTNPDTGEKEATPIGSLPSGTYIHENTYDYDLRMWEISYYPGGSSSMGWVSRDNLVDATKWVYYSDGSGDPLPEALVNDPAALKAYMDRVMPGYSLHGDGSNPVDPYITVPEDGQATKPTQESGSKESRKEPAVTASWSSESEQSTRKVEVSRLGFSSSEIVVDGKRIEVKTNELSFSDTAPEGKKLAVIYAPRSGKVSLRKSANANAKVIKKVKAGTIVIVLEEKGEWIQIQDHNQLGYINRDCLRYPSIATGEKKTGNLSYNGKTNVSTTVNVRNDTSKTSYKVAEWKVGKEVTILDETDGWAAVEADGVFGYVLVKFITIPENQ